MKRTILRRLATVVGLSAALGLAASSPASAPVPVGGLVELAPLPEDENLVKNSSFETLDASGRPTAWRGWQAGHMSPTTAEAHSGASSVEMKDAPGARYIPDLGQNLALTPGWYTLRGWIKAKEGGAADRESGGRFSLWVGRWHVSTGVTRGTFDWTSFERRSVLVAPGSTSATIKAEAFGRPSGTYYFDDIEVRRQKPPVVEAFLRYPNYRGRLFDDRPQAVVVSVTVRPEEAKLSLSEIMVRVSVVPEDASSAAKLVKDVSPTQPSFIVSLDAATLPHGIYRLTVEALRRDTQSSIFIYPTYRIVKLPAAARDSMRVAIDSDQVLLLGGRRVFPIGIFDTSGASPSTAFWEPRFAKIAEAPMSIYINYHQGNESAAVLDALMRAAQRYGIFYLHTTNAWYEYHPYYPRKLGCGGKTGEALGQDGLAACMARALRDHPGLAGWYIADEAPAERTEQIFNQYRILRESAPGGMTLIAQNAPSELVRWRDASDVFAVDPFALWGNYPEGTLAPMEMVTNWLERAQAAVERSRPVWGDIQFFQATAGGRWPTRDDLRTMSYMAIVAGAKGLIYWSYGARGLAWVKDPARREEYWQRLVSVTKEIKSLEPALLSPDAPDVLASHAPSGSVRVLAKRVGGARYLITVNNTPKEVRASFTLAEPARAVEVLGEQRTLQLGGAQFADGFAPYAVHVYKLEGVAATR